MAATDITGFPAAPQTEFARLDKAPLTGSLWEAELWNERPASMIIAAVTPVAGVATVTIAANNPTDEVGVAISGGTVPVVAGANADATAALLGPAILAAAFAAAFVDTATVLTNVVTVTGVLGKPLDLVEYSPDATSATVAVTTPAVVQEELCYGMGVVRKIPTLGTNQSIRKPTTLADDFVGVLVRTEGTNLPADQIRAYDSTYDPAFLMPGLAYTVAREDASPVVEFTGADPLEGDPVYLTMVGVNAGLWASTDGGVSQASTLTITSVADGNIAFGYDGLPDLVLLATAVAATDADALAVLWNASSLYAAIGAAIGNGDGTISLAFSDSTIHIFVDNSTGTSTAVEVIDTAASAATAKLIEQYSWGRPTISAAADTPARAFLRTSRS